jgi:putative membrane protein
VGFTLEPTQLAPVAVAALAYGWRARTLRRRGRPVPAVRRASFAAGLAAILVALVSPLDRLGETRLFSAHMAQHVLLGDVAPLLVVCGLTGPLLRPLLARRAVRRLQALGHPLLALPLWLADLWLWHLPALYDAALRNDVVHALEHASFFAGGALFWSALLGPLPGPRWFGRGQRLAALGVAWLGGTVLANVFLWSERPFYAPYVHAPRTWGLSAVADQRAGGGVMLVEMAVVGAVAFVLIGLDWLAAAERRQRALERRPA